MAEWSLAIDFGTCYTDTTTWQVIVGDLPLSVTRTEFEAAIMEDLRATITAFEEVVTRAGLSPGELAAVYLTGGSSRIPLVGDLLSQLLGCTPDLAGDPKAVVTLGALRAWATDPSETEEEKYAGPTRAVGRPGGRPMAQGPLLPPGPQVVSVIPKVPYFSEPNPEARGVAVGKSPVAQLASLAITGAMDMATKDRQMQQALHTARGVFDRFLSQMALFCLGSTDPDPDTVRERLEEQHEMWEPLLERQEDALAVSHIRSVAEDVVAFVREHYRILPQVPVIKPVNAWTNLWISSKMKSRWAAYSTYLEGLAAFFEPPVEVDGLGQAMLGLRGPIAQANDIHIRITAIVGLRSTPMSTRVEQLSAQLEQLREILQGIDKQVRKAVAEGEL
ncbi:Hsp70 family protein [Sphaerimonospora cavernae]|uniref:Hsp70 family protein n=1 Tax=Sphaerimonospora cavernae TaxID=1740611 RepID=A0ABV6U4I0_9ACTN